VRAVVAAILITCLFPRRLFKRRIEGALLTRPERRIFKASG
jgi:hypothetical protein